jgi:V-type H+-transporting ATPase subunit G
MSAQNSTGIQTLLDAERDAAKIIQQAREFRTKRVKEARDEARVEITRYQASKEDAFQKFEAEHTQGNEAAASEANTEAETNIQAIRHAGVKSEARVVGDLLRAVFDVQPVA